MKTGLILLNRIFLDVLPFDALGRQLAGVASQLHGAVAVEAEQHEHDASASALGSLEGGVQVASSSSVSNIERLTVQVHQRHPDIVGFALEEGKKGLSMVWKEMKAAWLPRSGQ